MSLCERQETLRVALSDLQSRRHSRNITFIANVHTDVERTGAGVECRTPVPEVLGSILSRGAVRCGLEESQKIHSSWGNGQKLIDLVRSKKAL